MHVYVIDDVGCGGDVYTVVADDYSEAYKKWRDRYHSDPKAIKLYSKYVIL